MTIRHPDEFLKHQIDALKERLGDVEKTMTTPTPPGRVPSPIGDFPPTPDVAPHGGRAWPIGPDNLTEPERRLAALRAKYERAVAVVRMGEWSPTGACSICKRVTWQGHHSSCLYAAVLKEAEDV